MLAVPVLAADCAGADLDASAVVFDTIGAVVHVRNPPEGQWQPEERWTVREILRIGALDGPREEMFSGPLLTAAGGPDGLIYVLDYEAELLSVFSSDGTFVRHVGGPGRGPGEFSAPSALTWDAYGRLWVADPRGRYSVFGRDAELLRMQPRPVRAVARRQHPLRYLVGGRILDEASAFPWLLFVSVDTAGMSVDTGGFGTPSCRGLSGASPSDPIARFRPTCSTTSCVRSGRWVPTAASGPPGPGSCG